VSKVGGGDTLFGEKVRNAQNQCSENPKNVISTWVKENRKKRYILGTFSIDICHVESALEILYRMSVLEFET